MELLTGLGLAVPAGLNAYIPLLAVAIAEAAGWVDLREPYALLGSWWAIALIAVLLLVEILADKIPGVDHVNDVLQTVMRPAAGGLLMAASMSRSGIDPAIWVFAGVLLAGGVHAAKAATRPVVNAATGGTGAPVVSILEDILAAVTSILALVAPVLVGVALAAIAFMLWRLWVRRRRSLRPHEAYGGTPGP
ncbi:MAG: DUF4126 domain-containing protein [Coriobacteriia bacterium]|nr:DUF4126 domain-containing protein [Coriobacteriia bacterium]